MEWCVFIPASPHARKDQYRRSAQHKRPLDYYEEKMTPLLSKLNTSGDQHGPNVQLQATKRAREMHGRTYLMYRLQMNTVVWVKLRYQSCLFPNEFLSTQQNWKLSTNYKMRWWYLVLWITLQHPLHFKMPSTFLMYDKISYIIIIINQSINYYRDVWCIYISNC